MLYRSLTLGLLGACLILLAHRSAPVIIRTTRAPVARPPLVAMNPLTIVDVAPTVRGEALVHLVRLAPNEHVLDVNDHPVRDALEAGAAIAWPTTSSYVDVSVGGGARERRVLLLLH
jgi:hypothetical protein